MAKDDKKNRGSRMRYLPSLGGPSVEFDEPSVDEMMTATEHEKRPRRGNPDQDELAELLAATQHKANQKAAARPTETIAAGTETATTETTRPEAALVEAPESGLTAETVAKAAAIAGRQIEADTAAVLDLKPTDEAEPIDSAVLEQSADGVRAQAQHAQESIDAVWTKVAELARPRETATPAEVRPEKKPEKEFRIGDIITYQGQDYPIKKITQAGKILIETEKDGAKKVLALDRAQVELPQPQPEEPAIEPPPTIETAEIPKAIPQSEAIVAEPAAEPAAIAPESLPIQPEAEKPQTVSYDGKKYPVLAIDPDGNIQIEYTAANPKNPKESRVSKIWLDSKHEKVRLVAPENLPVVETSQMSKPLTLKEWENARRAQEKSLVVQYGRDIRLEEGVPASPKTNKSRLIEGKMAEWERKHPKPLIETDEKAYQKMMKAAEAGEEAFKKSATERQAEIPPGEEIAAPADQTEIPAAATATAAAARPENISAEEVANLPFAEPIPLPSKEIYNEAKLRRRLKGEKTRLTPEQKADIAIEARRQAEFVKVGKVEMAVQDKLREVLKREGAADVKAELAALLTGTGGLQTKVEARQLAARIANETGLDLEQVKNIFNNSEEAILARATQEVNAGVAAGEGGRLLKISESGKTKIAKIAGYVGLGLLAAGTGGLGAAGIIGLRVVDRFITDKIKKGAVSKKAEEIRARIAANPAEQDQLLNAFFTDLAVSKQKQIHEVTLPEAEKALAGGEVKNFSWEEFLKKKDNQDLMEGYDKKEKADVVRSLDAIEEIDHINNARESGLSDKLLKTKYGGGLLKFVDKWLIKGGEDNSEKLVSVAAIGAAAYVARELPIIRNILRGAAGWKAGEFLAGKMIKDKKTERLEISDRESAEDIMAALEVLTEEKSSDAWIKAKDKRTAIKVATALSAAFGPDLVGLYLNHHGAEAGLAGTGGAAAAAVHEPAPVAAAAAAPEAMPALAENPLAKAIEDMQSVHGKDSRHLWGLIDKKVSVMAGDLGDVKGMEEFSGSEGRMSNVIDTIKREIAANPAKYGFHEGTNIDVVTATDLENVSQNEAFNKLIADSFRPGSLVEHAEQLSAETVRNIEARNAFYNETVNKIPLDVRLGQSDYDLLTELHGKGIGSEAAAQMIMNDHIPAGATEHLATTLPAGGAETAAALETAGAPLLENFQDNITRDNWGNVWQGLKNQDKNLVGKSLDAIFRRTGLAANYDASGLPYFKVENVSWSGGKLAFEVPAPAALGEAAGNMRFSFDPANNELLATAGDVSENIKNIKNIDSALKAAFHKISEQL